MGQLDGKVAIITGGATGIGRGIARAFAVEGASLVIASRNVEKLEHASSELRQHGVPALPVRTDVTQESDVSALFERTADEYGRLDILVNNAGVMDGGPLEELSLETWQKVVDVNLTGVFLCSREAMRVMKRQGQGRIINIGSVSAQMPRMNSVPYATTKHALAGLTQALALEGRDFGVVASCLHPGNVLSDLERAPGSFTQEEPMMTPDELAVTVVAMAALPPDVNMLHAIVLPVGMPYLGRG